MSVLDDMDLIGDTDLIGDDEVGDTANAIRSSTRYSPKLMKAIFRKVSRGVPIRVILRADEMPNIQTFYAWLDRYGHREEYNQLRVKPMIIDDEVANEIIYRIANGETFKQIRDENPEMPDRLRFKEWLKNHPEMNVRYHDALAIRAEGSVDEMQDIADSTENDWTVDRKGNEVVNNEAIARSKLRIEVRKWVAGKFNARFQDRNTTELVGAEGAPLIPPQANDLDLARRVAFLLSQGAAQL